MRVIILESWNHLWTVGWRLCHSIDKCHRFFLQLLLVLLIPFKLCFIWIRWVDQPKVFRRVDRAHDWLSTLQPLGIYRPQQRLSWRLGWYGLRLAHMILSYVFLSEGRPLICLICWLDNLGRLWRFWFQNGFHFGLNFKVRLWFTSRSLHGSSVEHDRLASGKQGAREETLT